MPHTSPISILTRYSNIKFCDDHCALIDHSRESRHARGLPQSLLNRTHALSFLLLACPTANSQLERMEEARWDLEPSGGGGGLRASWATASQWPIMGSSSSRSMTPSPFLSHSARMKSTPSASSSSALVAGAEAEQSHMAVSGSQWEKLHTSP